MDQSILIERRDDVATVILNRPERRNALDRATWIRFAEAVNGLSDDEDLRCLVVRGAGEDSFSAGADISAFEKERASPDQVRRYAEATHAAIGAIANCRHPVIAMIHGACFGGGVEIAVACDLRIAGESALFGVPVKRVGLFLGYPLLTSLLAVAGRGLTLEMVLEGRVLEAAEACERGLITRLVADSRLADETYATAQRIADGAPLAARWHRKAVRRLNNPIPIGEDEIAQSFSYAETEDYRAAYEAFLAKRKPRFRGR